MATSNTLETHGNTSHGLAPAVVLPRDEEKRKIFIKEIVFGFLLLMSAVICGWAIRQLSEAAIGSVFIWPPAHASYLLLAPLGFSVVFCLFSLSVFDIRVRVVALLISTVALHVFFPFQNYFVGSIVLATCFMMLADWEAKTEYRASTHIVIRKVVGRNLGYFFTGTALAMSFLYYSVLPTNANMLAAFVPKPLFENILSALARPLGSVLPGFSPHASIDDFITKSLKQALAANGQFAPDAMLREEVRRQREAYAKNSGMQLTGREEVVDVLYTTATVWAQNHAGPYTRYIPAALAVGYFMALKTLSILYYITSMLIMYCIVKILISMKVFKIYTSAVEKENISL